MNIDKEREAFENLWLAGGGNFDNFIFSEDQGKYAAIENSNLTDKQKEMALYVVNNAYLFFVGGFKQAAKAQVVQEGFVLVPKLLSDELADELAIDAFNNIQSMFDYEHRGSTATHREEIRLRWCKNKARDFQENYKAMIEAQEQSHD